MRVWRCTLQPEDFLYFVSKEFNASTIVHPMIHNYALTYSLGKQFRVVAIDNEPDYSELDTYEHYATPALPISQPGYVSHTYNSVCTKSNVTQSLLNVPSLGKNRKISPVSTIFDFLVFSTTSSPLPSYVRVGKKSCICRIESRELVIINQVLEPDSKVDTEICFNLLDLSPNDVVYSADMILAFPSPVARSMTVRAPHLILSDDGSEFVVPIPKHLRSDSL